MLPQLLTALLVAGPPGRVLLCRPKVVGDADKARPEAVAAAAKRVPGERIVDYGVPCEDAGEAARAAGRAGLSQAISGAAEGHPEWSHFALTLTDAQTGKPLAQREVDVALTADPAGPLAGLLTSLLDLDPQTPLALPPVVARSAAPWWVAGAGGALLALGGGFALAASSAAAARDAALTRGDTKGYVQRDASWRSRRTVAGVALGAGGAVLAAGLVWRFAF